MSICEQVEDAAFLAQHGRYVGALTILVLAVAASSRRTFPKGMQSIEEPTKEMSDREAFTLFLGGRIRKILFGDFGGPDAGNSGILVPFRGKKHDVAYVLYKFYRCELVHDGELPEDVEFTAPEVGIPQGLNIENQGIRVSISAGEKMVLDYGWIDLLIKAVVNARCNGPEFGIQHYDLIPLPGIEDQAFLEELATKYGTSLGRVQILKHAVRKLSPVSIIDGTNEAIAAQFQGLVDSGEINGGAITGLFGHGFTDQAGRLLERGFALLREVASGYQRVETS
jgi:hypothetical protein